MLNFALVAGACALGASVFGGGRARPSKLNAVAVTQAVDIEKGARGTRQTVSSSSLLQSAESNLLNNYGRREVVMSHGEGHYIWDVEGRRYLDFTSGIAVNCLGHSDPGWAGVVAKQAATLTHTSNMFLTEPQIALAEKLVQKSFADKAFFCNSGTEANEAAIKFARKWHYSMGKPREKILAFDRSFHGRTMGALSLTYKENYKTPFLPLMPDTSFLPYNDTSALEAINEDTCAVFVEPMQGEGGVIPATSEFLKALRKRCDDTGTVLVFDEVQAGLGRTGKLFAYENTGVTPDLLTMAKPLAAGLPVGAVLLTHQMASVINPGDHGSTFAGGPLVMAAANYVVDRVSDKAFLANVTSSGDWLQANLRALVDEMKLDATVRGLGLLVGVQFKDADVCGRVQAACRQHGLLVLTAGSGDVLRVAPALTATSREVDEAMTLFEAAFHKVFAK
jgi:predicted acetylornithine/succinylornithine family transaminase